MSFSDGMENYETRRSYGFCGICNKTTAALWERIGANLRISCEKCGTIILEDKNKFKPKGE